MPSFHLYLIASNLTLRPPLKLSAIPDSEPLAPNCHATRFCLVVSCLLSLRRLRLRSYFASIRHVRSRVFRSLTTLLLSLIRSPLLLDPSSLRAPRAFDSFHH